MVHDRHRESVVETPGCSFLCLLLLVSASGIRPDAAQRNTTRFTLCKSWCFPNYVDGMIVIITGISISLCLSLSLYIYIYMMSGKHETRIGTWPRLSASLNACFAIVSLHCFSLGSGPSRPPPLRLISVLTLSLLRLLDSSFPGNPLRAWEFHPLQLRLCLSQTL